MIKIYELEDMCPEKREFYIKRSSIDIEGIKDTVKSIIRDVEINGDFAIKKYTEKFDGAVLDSLKVSGHSREAFEWKRVLRRHGEPIAVLSGWQLSVVSDDYSNIILANYKQVIFFAPYLRQIVKRRFQFQV